MQWGQGVDSTFSTLVTNLQTIMAKGLTSVMIFGVVDNKDERGSMADDESTPVIKCTAALRKALPELLVACDVCMYEYNDHGHCGILRDVDGDHAVDNRCTLKRLMNISSYGLPIRHDGNRIGTIRQTFNENGFEHVSIMAYTSKKASVMYAPFRDAVESTFKGYRKRYQHPVGSTSHATLAFERDVNQGADSEIVNPALFYSDIVASFAAKKLVPVVCYLVSGEYKMVKDYGDSTNSLENVVREAHIGLLRAGASVLITYFTS
ncbi:hypothetical protein PsorP6_005540 [Peronosclerospora sorghi]|uniref:Uncharacterized protein n=1 Tax=Peronosclerospora sorghi TaxID=230839 RepID=A0ACC0W502_9STRA|nr:hypothetical protein PsorP6_005540 [Peronosclerospora sorghi]